MADLAIGISKKVVDGLVKKVEGAIKEEQELWQIVERDSVFIKDEFEMMKSFLRTADRDRVRNSVVRTWVRQVRDLSYDAEDCMDGVLDLEPKRPWWALSFLPRVLPPCCRPRVRVGKALDDAVDKIKLIKARVEEVSHRNLRYNLINGSGSQQIATAMDMDLDLDLDLTRVQEGSLRLRWLLMGYEGCQRRVISVWGTGGGLGTISIIRNVFDNPQVCQDFECRAWVKLMHPFSPQKFLGDLVAQLLTNSGATCGADILSKMEAPSVHLAKEVEHQLVKGRPYLIVLEDLSSMVEWDTIRTYLPDDENGSRVVVSTQHREIAGLCTGQPQYLQELSQFSSDHSVYAFFKEIHMPSQQNQGSMDVTSLSAAANYWDFIPTLGRDEEVFRLSGLIYSCPPNGTHVVTVLGPSNIIEQHVVVAKVCFQWVLDNLFTPSFELYGWVNVSNPFDVWGFAQSLLSVLRPNSPYHSTDPVGECSRLLREHRCLVVINGLRRTEDCSALESAGLIYSFPPRDEERPTTRHLRPPPIGRQRHTNNCIVVKWHTNNCIVVVTTEESVATHKWTEAATSTAVCNIGPIPVSGQDRLLHTGAGSMSGSSRLLDSVKYWHHYCLTGRDEELCQLYKMIYSRQPNFNGARVVTVCGPPGVGKSTLVAKAYSHYVLIDRSSFQLYGWVDVSSNSNHPLGLEQGFSQSLLSYMRPQLTTAVPVIDNATDPIRACSNLLTVECCLVVIEGLQSMEDCQKLIDAGLIYGDRRHLSSCFILITAEENVATFWKGKTPHAVCNVKPLNGQLPSPRSMVDGMTRLFRMANCCLPKYSSIIGRKNEVDRISRMISLITDQDFTRVIVIWAPPGVGKTALVEKVYSQLMVNRYSQLMVNRLTTRPFFQQYGWVQVSNPFNLMGFSRSLLSVLRPHSPESPDPVRECSNLLRNHSCLVVIDGLQCMENFWELTNAGLIYGHPNSCIVLITTEKSVKTRMASLVLETDVFQVKPLDWQSARELFEKVYGQPISSSVVHLVDKCCGLPIVILAVATYLSRVAQDAATQFTAAVKGGEFIHELATNPEPEFAGLKGLLAWVDSDLKACPQSLKLLILYMSNFSEETVVRRKRLVRRWIAEGYIKNTGICDMVTEAEERFRELEDLTMMMVKVTHGPSGRNDGTSWQRGCQLSGFSGEVLMSRAAEDPLFLPLEVSALTEGKRSLTSRGCAGRHLRIDNKWRRDEFVFRSLDLSRLRSLTVFGSYEAFFINDSMRVLRVLDLEEATGVQYSHLEKIPKLLPRLRFLSLRGCRDFDRLPDSIGDLSLLQTLDIRLTEITTLPRSILKLRNLQCLRAGHSMKARTGGGPYTPWRRRISSRLRGLASCSWQTLSNASRRGVTMPRGMSQLTALHTLGIVNVNTAGGEAILEELQHLKQLRKVELSGINSYNVRGLRRLHRYGLDSLSLGFTEDRDFFGLHLNLPRSSRTLYSSTPKRRIKLHGHVGILQMLPSDVEVTDLTLEIADTRLTEDNMKRIGELQWVRTLRLHFHDTPQAAGGNKLMFDANNDGFPGLEVLEITSRVTPVDVAFVPVPGRAGALKKTLKVLKLVGQVKIPTGGLHILFSLKEVWTDHGATMRHVLEEHPNKPAVIDFGSRQFQRYLD